MNQTKKKHHLSVVIILCTIITVAFLLFAFSQQWSFTGYSKLLNISISEEEGLEEIYQGKEYTVYTYQLDECYSVAFLTGEAVDLEDALEDGLSWNTLTGCLKKEKAGELTVYKGENYQIVQSGTAYIICSLQQNAEAAAAFLQ